jgi:hypothetical protein
VHCVGRRERHAQVEKESGSRNEAVDTVSTSTINAKTAYRVRHDAHDVLGEMTGKT